MEIRYTCPKCGTDLINSMLTSDPPKNRVDCPNCGWFHIEEEQDDVVRIPYTVKKDNVVDMGNDFAIYCNDTMFKIPEACRGCSNHPSNGGSGVCHCILGMNTVYC